MSRREGILLGLSDELQDQMIEASKEKSKIGQQCLLRWLREEHNLWLAVRTDLLALPNCSNAYFCVVIEG